MWEKLNYVNQKSKEDKMRWVLVAILVLGGGGYGVQLIAVSGYILLPATAEVKEKKAFERAPEKEQ